MTTGNKVPYSTRPVAPELLNRLAQLQPGQRIRITQRVKVGSSKTWQLTVEGTFRHLDSLATGLATDRVPQDDIIVPAVHFTKDNQEMSSITVDEHTRVEVVNP
jgi:hypothetical protein